MTTSDQGLDQFDHMDVWKLRVMCASAVERAAPLFRRLGRPASQETFEAGLNAVWDVAATDRIARTKSARYAEGAHSLRLVMRMLKRLPEAKLDDPHRPVYFAGCVLVLLVRALEYATGGSADKAKDCAYEAAALCDGIDVSLSARPGQTFIYDPKHPPRPGDLEKKELRLQSSLLRRLRGVMTPDPSLLAELRESARADAAIYEAVLAGLAAARPGGERE